LAEAQDIVLRDAHVLEQLPGGMGQARRPDAGTIEREIADGLVESGVGLASA